MSAWLGPTLRSMRANVAKRMTTTATARPLMITTGCCMRFATGCSFWVRLLHCAVVGRQLVRRGELRPSVDVRDALLDSQDHDFGAALEVLAGFGARAIGVARPPERVHDLAGSAGVNRARDLGDDSAQLKVFGREHREPRIDELRKEDEDKSAADQTHQARDRGDRQR